MRWVVVACFSTMVVGLTTGCQEARLRDRTVMQAVTVNDLYYQQVLNNLAMIRVDSGAMPYFSQPNQGTNQSSRSLMANYTPGWDFISSKGAYVGRWLFDKNSSVFGGTIQNTETWQTNPTTNPDKIYLLKLAFDQTLGLDLGDRGQILTDFMTQYPTPFKIDYLNALKPGWYCAGKKKDVPKDAAYVGHYGDSYVWVMPSQTRNLSSFTLAVLDIVTASARQGTTTFDQGKVAADKIKAQAQSLANNRTLDTAQDYNRQIGPLLEMVSPLVSQRVKEAMASHRLESVADEQSLAADIGRITDQVVPQAPLSILAPRDIPIIPYPSPPSPPPIP